MLTYNHRAESIISYADNFPLESTGDESYSGDDSYDDSYEKEMPKPGEVELRNV